MNQISVCFILLYKLSFVLLINVCLEMKPYNYASVENGLLGNMIFCQKKILELVHQTWTCSFHLTPLKIYTINDSEV